MFKKNFKSDRGFVEFIRKFYPKCPYFDKQIRINNQRAKNVIRGVKLIQRDTLDDDSSSCYCDWNFYIAYMVLIKKLSKSGCDF